MNYPWTGLRGGGIGLGWGVSFHAEAFSFHFDDAASTWFPTSGAAFRSEMSASASAMPMSDPSPRYASEGDKTRARFRRSPSPVRQTWPPRCVSKIGVDQPGLLVSIAMVAVTG